MVEPITTELRNAVNTVHREGFGFEADEATFDPDVFYDLCDAIDVIHAHLEAENAGLKASYEALLGEVKGVYIGDDDPVNHPSHYTQGRFEVIDVIEDTLGADSFRGYCLGNVIKYTLRHEYKGGTEDLRKAQWYLNRLLGGLDE